MNDLISREAALKAVNAYDYRGFTVEQVKTITDGCAEELRKLPAIYAEPVRQGKWITEDGMMPPEYYGKKRCSICTQFAMHDLYGRERLSRYCPNCGAKMNEIFVM